MNRREPPFRVLIATLIIVSLTCSASLLRAEMLGPGKYGGIVLFDRWDGCHLYRGVHVMHVSEKIKETLRERAGQFVHLDVAKLRQVINPGDAMIQEYAWLRDTPGFGEVPAKMPEFRDLQLTTAVVIGSANRPQFKTVLRSKSKKMLHLPNVHPILLTRASPKEASAFRATDGPSIELGLPILFSLVGDDGRPRGDVDKKFWRSKLVDMNHTLEQWQFELQPDAPLELTFELNVPPGEYQILFGYQTGQDHNSPVLYSAPINFDVEKREVHPTE
jgi:hypothetical protein